MKRRALIALSVLMLVVLGAGGGWFYVRTHGNPMAQARTLIAAGNYRAAQVELRNAIRQEPRNAEAHLEMAKLQMKMADPVAADVEFKAARAVGADPWVVTPLLGEAMIAEGLNRETLAVVPPRGPTPAIAARNLLMRSVAQLALHDMAGANESLAQLNKVAPDSVEALLVAARLAAARGDFAATQAKVDEVLKVDPKQIDALLMKEQLETSKGDHAAGFEYADRAVRSAPWSAMARMRRANQFLFKGEDAKAQGDVDAVLSVQPRFIEAIYLRALIMARAGKFQDAVVEMDKLGGVAQKFPQALYYQGMLASVLGRTETALDFARRYNTLVPGDPDGVRLLARMELETRRPDEALALLQKVVAGGQTDAATLDLLGSAYAVKGNTSKASQTFSEAVALAPNDPAILAHYGVTQVQLGEVSSASITLQRSMDIAPGTNPTAAEALVSALLAEGKLDAAEKALAGLKARVGDTLGVGVLAGQLRLRRGDVQGAREAFADTLRRFPTSQLAKLNLARMLVRQGQRSEGMAMMAEILAKKPDDAGTLDSYIPLLVQDRQLPPAAQALTSAHAASPAEIGFSVMLSDVLTMMGDPRRAITMLNVPPDLQAPMPMLGALARAQTAAGLSEEAKASYRAILKQAPGNLMVRSDYVSLLVQTKDPAGALAALRDGLALAPGNFRIMTDLVSITTASSGLDKGLAVAAELRQNPANMPDAAYLRGDEFSRARRPKDAAAAYLEEYTATQTGQLLMRLTSSLVAVGQFDDATRYLSEWLQKHPDTPDVAEALAQLDIRAKRYGDAETHLGLVLAKRPDDALALNNLAWIYLATGDKRARETAQRSYLQRPTSDAADTLGWIMVREGDFKAGLPLLQRASAMRPKDPSAQYHLAVALRDDGQPDAAAKVLQPIVASGIAFDDSSQARVLLDQLTQRK